MAGLGCRVCEKQLDYILGVARFMLYDVVHGQGKTSYLGPFSFIVKIEGKDLRTKKGKAGRAASRDLRSREASSKNLCSVQAMTETRYVKMGVMDWSFHREDWKKQRFRSRLPRQPCGTGTSSLCRTRSGRWRLRQQNAKARSEGRNCGKERVKPAESLKRV